MKLKEHDEKFIDPIIYKIFNLVKTRSNITNFDSKSRIPELVKIRRVYFALCKRFTTSPLTSIGYICGNRDHTTVLYNITEFYNHYDDADFEYYKELYLKCYNEIIQWEEVLNKSFDDTIDELKKIKETYLNRLLRYQFKTRVLVSSYKKKLDNLRKREVFAEIAGLDDEDLDDFEVRAKAFLSMKRIKDKLKTNGNKSNKGIKKPYLDIA